MKTVTTAFSGGWSSVKLYFMIGLPTETLDDVAGIAALGQKVVDAFYANPNKKKGKGVSVTLSASGFVPKAFTHPSNGSHKILLKCFMKNSGIW